MKKRAFSTFLALVLCLTLLPTAAFAEGGATEENAAAVVNGTDYYSSFDAAYAAAQDGDTIQLRNDVKGNNSGNSITVEEGRSLTIDLNGFNLDRYITVEGMLTLKGDATRSTVLCNITVLGTLVVMDSVQIEAQTTLTLGSADRGGTLEVLSDSASIGATVQVINKGNTKLTHGKFSKFTIDQENIRIMDLLAEGYAFLVPAACGMPTKTRKPITMATMYPLKRTSIAFPTRTRMIANAATPATMNSTPIPAYAPSAIPSSRRRASGANFTIPSALR